MKRVFVFFIILPLFQMSYSQIIKQPIPDKLVVFTFDDATASQYHVVAPLLKQYGFGATFFVCEFPTKSPGRSAYMDWGQIKELDTMGFEIANHTRSHIKVDNVSEQKVIEELEYIEGKCDSLEIEKPENFAYPGYNLCTSAMDILHEKGYKFARAGGSRPYDPEIDHPLLIPSWAMKSDNKEQIMAAFKEAKDGKIVVLTIHGVPDVEHRWVNTPPELFREYLQYLSDHHFKVISFKDLESYVAADKAYKKLVPDLTKKLRN